MIRNIGKSRTNFRVIDSFIDEVKDEVQEQAAKVAKSTLKGLFQRSPHYGASYAKGEYDANHKVSVNGWAVSNHVSPTGSRSASKSANRKEQKKVDQHEDRARTYTISNNTDHADDVETGDGWPVSNGYFPYLKTLEHIKRKHSNVLK